MGMQIIKHHPQLKPCPFCGGKAHIVTETAHHLFYKITVVCGDCGAKISMKDGKGDLVDAICEKWNKREEIKT